MTDISASFHDLATRLRARASVARLGRATPVAVALAVALAAANTADAQVKGQTTVIKKENPNGSIEWVPIPKQSAFNLFASEDLAVAGMRMTGYQWHSVFNFGGPAPVYYNSGGPNIGYPFLYNQGTNVFFFEMGFVGGAPISDFRKIRSVYPGVNGMRGAFGYTAPQWDRIVGTAATQNWGSADGQFGKLFAGVLSTADGSCRDLNGGGSGFNPAGLTLAAMKDCPASWPAAGFGGKLVIPDSVWRKRFAASPSTFRWDDWKIAPTELDATQFLGQQSTYSVISDYFREQKVRYGSVVPGGAGAPLVDGYPLGLEVRQDVFQFGSPAVRNTVFYQLTMVNKSADVYGRGVDYDSLYFGVAPGMVTYGQSSSWYADLSKGAIYFAPPGISGKCSATYPTNRYTNASTGGCPTVNTTSGSGVFAMQWLKSPLGDLRNKLFSNPASPYYNPTSPLADDTITVNHAKPSSFGNIGNNFGRSTRATFGMISSTEDNYLDGRAPTDVPASNFVFLWAPETWNGAVTSAVKFSRFAPGATTNPATGQPFGKWDYNNDGVQDTIAMPFCGSLGCAVPFSDSSAGGYRNSFGNIQNSLTAGPFKLKSGDTTQFIWAFSLAADTSAIKANVQGVLDSYLGNYAGAAAIPYPTVDLSRDVIVESAELRDSVINSGTSPGGTTITTGRVIIRPAPINSADQFILRTLAKLRQDSAAGDPTIRRLTKLNPGILDQIQAIGSDNLSEVLIFKSCDNGASFTTGNGVSGNVGTSGVTCAAAPTRNINDGVIAFPYRPWARIAYVNGIPQTATLVDNVQAGRNYLYSFVTRSKGFRDLRVIDSIGGQLAVTDVGAAFGLPVDTINSAVSLSGGSTANVYVPVSLPTTRSFARIDTSTVLGRSTQGLRLENVNNNVSGSFRVLFANRFIIRRATDTLTSATTTTVQVQTIGNAQLPGGTTAANAVLREYTFTAPANIPVRSGTNTIGGTLRSTQGSAKIFIDTVVAPAGRSGYAVVNDSAKSVLFVTNDVATTNLQQSQQSSPLYPGFTVVPEDSVFGTTGVRQERLQNQTTRARAFLIRAPGDTINGTALQVNGAGQFMPQVLPFPTTAGRRVRGGAYELTWATDPWGPGAPFTLKSQTETQAEVTASLSQVTPLATTVTDTSARVAALVGATAARPLQRVRLPFTMTFRDAGTNALETVSFAMLKRASNTRLLGSGNDTIRVNVPDTLWMPGDSLVVLQKIERDSVVVVGAVRYTVVTADNNGGVAGFSPVRVKTDSIGFARFLVGCLGGAAGSGVRPIADASTCNPLAILSRGASTQGGYLAVTPGLKEYFEIARTFDPGESVALRATAFSVANPLTQAAINRVAVVPNPFIVRSEFDPIDASRNSTPRVLFTSVPEAGTVRIYTVSGQLVQVLSWTRNDLVNIGQGTAVGDLPYNLQTREGLTLNSGLYMYVLSATDSGGKRLLTRGKFVIIR